MSHPAGTTRTLVIDRFEGDWAVVEVEGEGGEPLDLPRWLLPAAAREGDVLRLDLSVDEEATGERRERASAALDRLRARDPGGDIEL